MPFKLLFTEEASDVLDELDEIKVGIKSKGDSVEYKTFKGWKTNTTKCRDFDSLPKEAKEYLGEPLLGAISKIRTPDTILEEKERQKWYDYLC